MTEATLEIEDSESTTEVKQSRVETIPLRKKRIWPRGWIAIAMAAVVLTVGLWFLLNRRSRAITHQHPVSDSETSSSFVALSPEQQASVAVEVAQRRTLQSDITAPGKITFNGNLVTPVFSQFSGRIAQVMAAVGTTVRAGQTIAMIDTPDIVGLQTDYLQALTTERSSRITLELSQRTRERAARLADAEAIPRRDFLQAQTDEAHAADDLQRAQSAIAAARGRLRSAGMSEDEINRLAAISRSVNRIVPLVAPISGTITERKAGLGQVVQPGVGDPLFMIADLSRVWVTADVYEDQLAYLQAGTTVKIKTPAYPDETFLARVDQIGSTLDPDKHTVAVRCVVPNASRRLKPGMFASVILASGTSQTVITVPASAVISEGDQRAVFVEQAPGRYTKRAVETGSEASGLLIIRAGIKEGDRVVVHGGLLMSAGPSQ